MKYILALALTLATFTANAGEVFYRTNSTGETAKAVEMVYVPANSCYAMGNQGTTFYAISTSMTEVITGYKDAVADEAASAAFKEGHALAD